MIVTPQCGGLQSPNRIVTPAVPHFRARRGASPKDLNPDTTSASKAKIFTDIKKGKDTRAHRSPKLLLELERRLDLTFNSQHGFTCATTTKPEPLQVENYK
jgi:hypothetical protein